MGIKMEADTDTDLTGIDLQNIQGDGLDLDSALRLGHRCALGQHFID